MSGTDRMGWKRGDGVEKLQEFLREALETMPSDPLVYYADGLALPPWLALPDIPRYSIGWRMGQGEDYWCAFWDWYQARGAEEKSAYRVAYPCPEDWDDYYDFLASNS